MTASDLISMLDLEPLEGEGGFFRRTWFRPSLSGEGPEASCILFLITPDSFSALHRLKHDEMFHFYLGDPCRSVIILEDGLTREVILGHDLRDGMRVQHLVPAGTWQSTALVDGGAYALLGTTMSPGFHPDGFELATEDSIGHLDQKVQDIVRPLMAETK